MGSRLKHLPSLAIAFLLSLILIVRLFTSALTWYGVTALVVAIVWLGFEIVRVLLAKPAGSQQDGHKPEANALPEKSDDLISLVYFLTESRQPDESMIRTCVSNALGIKFDVSNPESEHFVMQFSPPGTKHSDSEIQHFMIRIPEGLYAVLVSGNPYIDNPEAFASQSIRDKRLRNAVENHRAWLSVDLMDGPESPEANRKAYRIIGRILATLAGPDCLAVYCPELQRCNEFDLSLIDTLSGKDPLEIFDEPTFEPIIEISDNNPRMAEAVEEAIKRWPEFVEAFQAREDPTDDAYIVKAEFREGKNCEYMWVSVEEISGTEILGTLMNDPHELLDLHRGAAVSISFDRLNDWIYPASDGSHAGGFTLDVLAEGDD